MVAPESWRVQIEDNNTRSSHHVEPEYVQKFTGELQVIMAWYYPADPLVDFKLHASCIASARRDALIKRMVQRAGSMSGHRIQ